MGWFDEVGDGQNTTQPVGTPTAGPGGQQAGAPPRGSGQVPDIAALQAIFSKYPATNEGFLQGVQEADATFGKGVWGTYLDHPSRLDKVQLPNGQVFDIMVGAGAPGASWANRWTPEGPSHGGGAAPGGAAGAAGAMGGMDPSYAFRFAEGQKALEKSAASKGTLLTGGHLKALANYGQQMASTEFGNIFNRNYQLAGLGLNAAQSAAGLTSNQVQNNSGLANNQAQTNTGLTTGAANARAGQQAGSGNAWGGTIADLGGVAADWVDQRERDLASAPLPNPYRTPTVYGGGSVDPNLMWQPYSTARSQR